MHDVEHLSDIGVKLLDILNGTVQESKVKATDIRNMVKNIEHTSNKLQVQYHKAQNEINETFAFYRSMLEERKQELLKEVESVYSAIRLASLLTV
jgi:tripartite motif-containing protein 2/3